MSGLTLASISSKRALTCPGSLHASSFFVTNQATGLRSTPAIWKPSRAPSTSVVPPPMKMSSTLSLRNGRLSGGCSIMVPDPLSRLGGVTGRFRSSRYQQTPKDAGAATGPPFGHLIDGLPALPSRLESALIGAIGKSTSRQTGGLFGSLKSGTGRRMALPRLGGS